MEPLVLQEQPVLQGPRVLQRELRREMACSRVFRPWALRVVVVPSARQPWTPDVAKYKVRLRICNLQRRNLPRNGTPRF